MATFTPPLWKVMEYEHDTGNGMRIGLDDYPIFDEAHRLELNQLIIDEYLNREIGLETIPLFTHRLRLKMRQIMPYYNQLFLSERLVFDPLSTFDLETTRNDATKAGSTQNIKNGSTITSGSGARTVNSDTPETMLSDDEDYATSATDANSTGSTNTSTTSDNTGSETSELDGVSRTKGYQGSAADLLQRYRSTFLNINMSVVRDCGDLFMLVISNGSEFLPAVTGGQLRRELRHSW
jgi:hypothetical protein